MKRWTEPEKKYSSGYLRALQAYENLGTFEELQMLAGCDDKPMEIYIRNCYNDRCQTDQEGLSMIRYAMKLKGFTNTHLDDLLCKKQPTISRVIRGKQGLYSKDWKKIGEILGVKIIMVHE